MLSSRFLPRLVKLVNVHPKAVSPLSHAGVLNHQLKSQTKISVACIHSTCFLKAKGKLKRPVDDVYLDNLYEPKSYNLEEAITTLKKNAELDFADENSLIYLNLGLYLRPGKKGRLQVIYLLCDLPHNVHHENKVCVFTENEDEVKLALDNGAYMAGSTDIVPKIMLEKSLCDAYISSPACLKSVIMPDKELVKKLGKLTPKRHRGTSEDIIASLLDLRDRTIITNQVGSGLDISANVAKIKQPFEEIQQNINFAMETVREIQNPNHPPLIEKGSVTCCQETIAFEIENESELD